MKQKRILILPGPLEIPGLVLGESLRLGVNPQSLVERNQHVLRGGAPTRHFVRGDSEFARLILMTFADVGGAQHISLRHEIRVDIVVRDSAVLVRAGDSVDAKMSIQVKVSERSPESSRLNENFSSHVAFEFDIVIGFHISKHRRGDVRVDVKGSRSGGPVPGTFFAVNRSPWKCRTAESQIARSSFCR